MSTRSRLEGLIAATYTPLQADGSLGLKQIGCLVEHLLSSGVDGLYVGGSTGEGMSLSSEERRLVNREFIRATAHRVPVIIQVGHNSLREAAGLAADAQDAGADIISATCPSYYPIDSLDVLIDSMAEVAAAAPSTPFYYYHIPILTRVDLPMPEFLQRGGEKIPNLAGLKFTKSALHEYQACLEFDNRRFDVVWGSDEMLLSALSVGARAAIGSTYNVAAGLYQNIRAAFAAGRMEDAQRFQLQAVQFIRTVAKYPFHPAIKTILGWQGVDCGPTRLPLPRLTEEESAKLRADLERLDLMRILTDVRVEQTS